MCPEALLTSFMLFACKKNKEGCFRLNGFSRWRRISVISVKDVSPSRIVGPIIGNDRFQLVEVVTSAAAELRVLNNMISKAARTANHFKALFGKTALLLVDPDPSLYSAFRHCKWDLAHYLSEYTDKLGVLVQESLSRPSRESPHPSYLIRTLY